MTAKTADVKLARQLQKRGKWNSYSSCLREVQKWLTQGDWSTKEISEMIDKGQLDPSTDPPEGQQL